MYIYQNGLMWASGFYLFFFLQSYRLTTPPPLKVPHVDIIHRKRRHSRGITKTNPLDSNNKTYVYSYGIFILSPSAFIQYHSTLETNYCCYFFRDHIATSNDSYNFFQTHPAKHFNKNEISSKKYDTNNDSFR